MNEDNVQEVMGMLVPLLLGGSVQDFLKRIFVGARGASANDSLMELTQKYNSVGNVTYGGLPNSQVVSDAIDKRLANLGINPYGGAGRGLNELLMSVAGTGMFPGLTENLIGVPQFGGMSQMARTGSVGINAASGTRYSFLDEPRMMRGMDVAMQRMRTMYDFSVKKGKEDVEYTHGLTGDEMGLINQRILSSSLAYTKDGGGEYDTNTEKGAREFTENLRKMGQKFNSVAATLNKVTGSMEETMRLLDGLAGGNFLDGTKTQVEAVANRAKNMAAAIRISAAEAGMTPQEAYKNMQLTTAGIGMSLGLNDTTMNAGGSSMFTEISAQTQQSFAKWKRDHPKASVEQQEAARLGIMNSVMRYEQSGAGSMALLVAQNRDKFSKDQLNFIRDAYGSGNAKSAQDLVRNVVGSERYDSFMGNEGAQIAARRELMSRDVRDEGRGLLLDLGRRGASSAAAESANYVARQRVNSGIRRAAAAMGAYGGDGAVDENAKESRTAEFNAIRNVARKWGVPLPEDVIATFSPEDPGSLMEYVKDRVRGSKKSVTGLEREVNNALIESQKKLIESKAMNKSESEAAKAEILGLAEKKNLNEGLTGDKIKTLVNEGRLEEAYRELSRAGRMTAEETRETGRRIFRGKISRSMADSLKADYKEAEAQFGDEFTEKEKKRAVADALHERQARYLDRFEGFRQDNKQSVGEFIRHVESGLIGKELVMDKDIVKMDGETDTAAIAREASVDTMKDLLDGQIGKKSGDDFKKMSAEWGKDISKKIMEGSTFEEAFLAVLKEKGVKSGAFKNQEDLDKMVAYYETGAGRDKIKNAEKTFKTKALGRTKAGSGRDEIKFEDLPQEVKERLRNTRASGGLSAETARDPNQAYSNILSEEASQEQTDLTQGDEKNTEVLEKRDLELVKREGPYLDKLGDNSDAQKSLQNAEESINELRKLIKDTNLKPEKIEELQKQGSKSEAFKELTGKLDEDARTQYSITLEGMRDSSVEDMLSLTDEEYSNGDEKTRARRQRAIEGVAKYQGRKDPKTGEDTWTTELFEFLRQLVDFFSESNFRRILSGVTVRTKEG